MSAPPLMWPGYQADDPTHRLIAGYLTVDIQKSREAALEILAKVSAVESRQISRWERIGNAYCLALFPDHAEITSEYAEESHASRNISLPLLKTAVQCWLQTIPSR